MGRRKQQNPNRLHADKRPAGVAATTVQEYTMEGVDHPGGENTMEGIDHPDVEYTMEGIDYPVQRTVNHSRCMKTIAGGAYGKTDSETPGVQARLNGNLCRKLFQGTMDHEPLHEQHSKTVAIRTGITRKIIVTRTKRTAHQPRAADPSDNNTRRAPPIHQHTTPEK